MSETKNPKTVYPTHIPSLDKVLGGGMPAGSTVLLSSEPGAGGRELLHTYVMNYCSAKLRSEPAPKGTTYPSALYYLSSTESKDNFKSSIADLFKMEEDESFEELMKNVHYSDLGGNYFSGTHVPYNWYGSENAMDGLVNIPITDDFGGLTILMDTISHFPGNSVVIVDSLTTYLPYCTSTIKGWIELVTMLRGLTRITKKWNSTIVIRLTAGVLKKEEEAELMDCCDGAINLFWQKNLTTKRLRQIYLQKFVGLLPHIADRDMVTFNITISTNSGFEITNMRVVS